MPQASAASYTLFSLLLSPLPAPFPPRTRAMRRPQCSVKVARMRNVYWLVEREASAFRLLLPLLLHCVCVEGACVWRACGCVCVVGMRANGIRVQCLWRPIPRSNMPRPVPLWRPILHVYAYAYGHIRCSASLTYTLPACYLTCPGSKLGACNHLPSAPRRSHRL